MTNRTTRSSFSIGSCLGGSRDSRDLMVQTFQLIMDNAENPMAIDSNVFRNHIKM